MKNLLLIAGLVLVAPLAQAQKGGVAVLDIDKVAQELRIDQSVLNELKEIENSLNGQLNQVRDNLQSQMNQLEASLSQQQTPQSQSQLLEANRKLNADFAAVRTEAQNRLVAARLERINAFRDKLRPISLEAAKAKGFDVVLTASPQLYANDPAVDITDDVIKRAKEAGMEQPAAPAADPQATPAVTPAPAAPAAPATPAAPAGENDPAKGAPKGN